jgi:hypothetical protein
MQQFIKIATAFFNQKLPVISPLMDFRNLNDSGNESILRSFCQSYLGDRLDEFNYNQLNTVFNLLSHNIIDDGFVFKNNKLYGKYNFSNSVINVFLCPTKYPNDDIKKMYLSALYLARNFITFAGSDFIENYIDHLDDKNKIDELTEALHIIRDIERETELYEFDSELFIVKYPEYKQLINLITWCKNLYKQNVSNYNTDGDIDVFQSCLIVPDVIYFDTDFVDYFWDLNNCYIDDLLVELDENLSMDIYPMAVYYLCNEIERKYLPVADTKKGNCVVC